MDEEASGEAAGGAIVRKADGTYAKGVSGNPAGRPLFARNRLAEAFLKDVIASWEVNGPWAIQQVLDESPRDYVRLVASILPKHFEIKVNELDELSDDELDRRIAALHAVIAAAQAGAGAGGEQEAAAQGAQPAGGLCALPQAG